MKAQLKRLLRPASTPQESAAPVSAPPAMPSKLKSLLREVEGLRETRQFAQALPLALQACRDYPDQARPFVALSKIYTGLRMPRCAIENLARAVRLNPADPQTAQNLAYLILKKAKTPVRDSIGEVMQFVQQAGFVPGTIIDIGINTGTPGMYEFFPGARFLLVDPLTESEVFMQDICRAYPGAAYEVCAVGSKEGPITISVNPAFGGTCVVDVVGRHSKGEDRTVPMKRLDRLVREKNLPGPYILKIDTEGAEMDVLEGASGILAETEMLILETRVRPYANAPDYLDVLEKLRGLGFLSYDFIDRNYHDGDGTLKQFDLVAVRREGYFRTATGYRAMKLISAEQHDDIIKGKLKSREALLKKISA